MIVVFLACGFEIKIGECDPSRVSWRQVEQRSADDCVVTDFELSAIFKDEPGRFLRGIGTGRQIGIQSRVRLGCIGDRRNVGAFAISAAITSTCAQQRKMYV